MAEAAGDRLLLVIDADVRLHPQALREAVGALEAVRADLLSALPRQIPGSPGEQLVVPVLPWSLFSFLPLGLAHRLQTPALAAAVGQFMLFRPGLYHRLGGHRAVRAHTAEDVALARRFWPTA